MIHRLPNSRKCRQYKGLRGAPKQKVISYEPNRDGLDFQVRHSLRWPAPVRGLRRAVCAVQHAMQDTFA